MPTNIEAWTKAIISIFPFIMATMALVGLMFDLIGPEDQQILILLLSGAVVPPVLSTVAKKVLK